MQDSCGSAALDRRTERASVGAARLPGAEAADGRGHRRRAIASSVMTVSAPLATDFSARNSVTRTMIPKNPAAASVSHIGKVGERQM